jgi:hypothetical protein
VLTAMVGESVQSGSRREFALERFLRCYGGAGRHRTVVRQ